VDLIRGFVEDCQARGLTAHTIETYSGQVKSFLHAFNDPNNVGLEDLRAFLGALRSRSLQGSTLRGYFAALGALYDYLVFEGAMETNPIPSFRKRYLSRIKEQHNGENTRQLISVQDMQLLVNAASGIRDKALLLTLAKTGIRRGELLSLQAHDINITKGIIRVPPKAKRSNRLAYMDAELQAALRMYLIWRKPRARTSWLWISKRGGRIHKDYPGKMIAELGEDLGFHDPAGPLCSKLTPHCFRHWFTTWLFRAGMDPEYIKWLRGDSLRSEAWQIYNHIDSEEVRQEYLRRIPGIMQASQSKNIPVRGSNTYLSPNKNAMRR